MPRYRAAYPPEFRRRMIDLVRAGRTPQELSREFEPKAETIKTWVKQAERDEGVRPDGLATGERKELNRLRRENNNSVWSAKFSQRPRPGLLGRPMWSHPRVPIHEHQP